MWLAPLCVSAFLEHCGLPQKITNSEKRVEYQSARQISVVIGDYAAKRNLDPYLIAAIMYVESKFGKETESVNGKDHGPMQINEWWFDRFGITRRDVLSLEGSVKWGTKILELVRDEAKGRGCWWTLYNSRNPEARSRYEVKVRAAFARLKQKPNCNSVNTASETNLPF